MTKENSTLSKRLKQYSALAGSMLVVTGIAHGQVMYTDIPDDTLVAVPFPGNNYLLDLNNDGTFDYVIGARGDTSYKLDFAVMYLNTAGDTNAIAGTVVPINVSHFVGYPSNLLLNDDIPGTLNFFKRADILNGSNNIFLPPMFSSSSGATAGPYGKWAGGVTDHYLAFKFSPDSGATIHYGWARCSLNAAGDTLIVEDYAYNATPGDPLFAGQGSPLGVSSANQPGNFNILAYEGMATIYINDGKPDGCTATVTNMLGETILRQPLTDRSTRIDLNQYAKGIYLITVQRGEESFSKKISFR